VLDPTSAPDAAEDELAVAVERPGPGTAVLRVAGEVDTLTAPRLERGVTELLATRDDRLVVDLAGVTFLASSGLAVLIRGAHAAERRGTRLRLVAGSRAVRRPLEITGSDQLFDLHVDVESACAPRD
jgi:anti-sigma B factor antagonist